jgi:Cu+-exporting ATPase
VVKDPVCGMDVDERTAQLKSEHMGKTYYFCSPGCRKSFDADPHKYVGEAISRQLRASPRLVGIWSKVRGRLWHEWLSSPDVASAIDLVGGCGYPIGVSQWMSRTIAASSLR